MSDTAGATRVLLPTLPCAAPLPEVVLFAFDDSCLPFQHQVERRLIPGTRPRVVLEHGEIGAHDEVLLYYGTVIRIGDKLRMWYVGNHGSWNNDVNIEREHCRISYAESDDGVTWEKPDLGLVEFNGSTKNNIVDLDDPHLWSTGAVLYDPEEPDPDRRFKMAYETSVAPEGPRFCVAFSPDGLRWTPFSGNPVGPFLEMTGVTKFRGLYYVNGQARSLGRGPFVRQLATFVSADFEHWSPVGALGLNRSPDVSGPSTDADLHQFEEIHLGAGLWNRGNVLLGIYGQWHGHPTGDRRLTAIDLGLAVSHDAVHFTEPIPGFRFVPAREQPGSPDMAYWPALQQGQGMENVGDRTLYWYSLWRGTPGSGVRMVSWERDRLGYLAAYSTTQPRVISCPIEVVDGAAELAVNAGGLGPHSQLAVSLLDEGFHPIPGASGPDAAILDHDGLRTPLRFPGLPTIDPALGRFRIDVQFRGTRPEDARLYAIYVS